MPYYYAVILLKNRLVVVVVVVVSASRRISTVNIFSWIQKTCWKGLSVALWGDCRYYFQAAHSPNCHCGAVCSLQSFFFFFCLGLCLLLHRGCYGWLGRWLLLMPDPYWACATEMRRKQSCLFNTFLFYFNIKTHYVAAFSIVAWITWLSVVPNFVNFIWKCLLLQIVHICVIWSASARIQKMLKPFNQ